MQTNLDRRQPGWLSLRHGPDAAGFAEVELTGAQLMVTAAAKAAAISAQTGVGFGLPASRVCSFQFALRDSGAVGAMEKILLFPIMKLLFPDKVQQMEFAEPRRVLKVRQVPGSQPEASTGSRSHMLLLGVPWVRATKTECVCLPQNHPRRIPWAGPHAAARQTGSYTSLATRTALASLQAGAPGRRLTTTGTGSSAARLRLLIPAGDVLTQRSTIGGGASPGQDLRAASGLRGPGGCLAESASGRRMVVDAMAARTCS